MMRAPATPHRGQTTPVVRFAICHTPYIWLDHRIGQKDPVFVTRFITQNTLEGRIADVLERKRQLFNELIEQNGPPPQMGLTEEELFGLFDIQARPKRAAA